MFKNLFSRNKKHLESASPFLRDTLRRLDGTPDDSATGRAIRDTEAVMQATMDVVPGELLNRNEATKGTSKFFIAGVAIAYSIKHGVDANDVNALAAVVRCTLRQWSSPRTADYMADHLGAYMTDEEWGGPVIEKAVNAVDAFGNGARDIARAHQGVLEWWCTYDTDAHYEKLKRLAFGPAR